MKLCLISLGCSKNTVDSEYLAGLLEASGVQIVDDADDADVAIVNTCGFIRPAVEESISAILDLEKLKETGKLKKIGLVGCLLNRYGEDLIKELPSVDLWAGAEEWPAVIRGLGLTVATTSKRGRLPETRPWTRYLKVGEGCDTLCSFCTIPSIRGRARSIPIPQLVSRAQDLVREGAKEICLVGQDLTVYGRDLYGQSRLKELLTALDGELPSPVWLRLLYLHPSRIDEAFIDYIAASPRVLSYLDIPIQHVDPLILAAMNRRGDEKHIRRIFSYARQVDPDFALRTTILLGFPGEREEHFAKVLDFLEEAMIDRVGAFIYYPEEGTPAAAMEGQVSEEIKEIRYSRLMELQSELSLERQRTFEGKTLTVLIDEIDREGAMAWGRSYREAPEVDGMIGIPNDENLIKPGQFLEVRITDAAEHDLFAEVTGP